MSDAQTPVDQNSPLAKAWKAYQETEEFGVSKHWALRISPFPQRGSLADQNRHYEIMPLEQRESHVMGSLWASFMAGFAAAQKGNSDV